MRGSGFIGGGLEYPPTEIGKDFRLICGRVLLDAAGIECKNLRNPRADQVGNGDEASLLNPIDQGTQMRRSCQLQMPRRVLALDSGKAK